MKVEGTKTVKTNEMVEVDPSYVLEEIHYKWLSSIGLGTRPEQYFINSNDEWEYEHPHPRGVNSVNRKATEYEIKVHRAFETLKTPVHKLERLNHEQ